MNGVPQARLTGRATRFLSLLRDFGHLTDDQLDHLVLELTRRVGAASEVLIDLHDVRALAAAALFEQGEGSDDPASLLGEDWPYLFY